MRFLKLLLVAMSAGFGLATLGTSPAAADSCPSEESVASAKRYDPPYMCAQLDKSGNKSLGTLQTKTWSDDVGYGYYVGTWCTYASSSAVSNTVGFYGPSFSDTATNWSTNGTRHFAAGVIFQTGTVDSGQYSTKTKCDSSKGWISNSILKITESVKLNSALPAEVVSGSSMTIAGKVSPSSATGNVGLLIDGETVTWNGKTVGAPIKDGKFTITWPVVQTLGDHKVQVSYPGDKSKCPQKAETCGYAPQNGHKYTVKIVESAPASVATASSASQPTLLSAPLVPAENGADVGASAAPGAKQRTGIWVANKSSGARGLAASCPKGYYPLNGEVFPGNTARVLAASSRGIRVRPGVFPANRQVQIQLTCRKGGTALSAGRMGLGTLRADRLRTGKKGAHLMGGPGADTLVVNKRRGVALGGLGDDRITVRTSNGIGSGGPGRDVLRSTGPNRTMLVGGPGRDRIVGTGYARIDADDGEADTITCRGSKVWVKADAKDQLRGACKRL